MTSSITKAILATATLVCFVSGPAQAATGLSFSNLSGAEYDTAGVYVRGLVEFTGTVDDGGGFDRVNFKLWDDGNVKFDQDYQVAVGSFGSFAFEVFYPGLVGPAAQGVGLYLYDSNDSPFIDPYDVPHYPDPSQCQRDCGPVTAVPEPSEYALMLMGLGAVGWAVRRRTQAAA